MLALPIVNYNGAKAPLAPADILAGGEVILATTTTQPETVTGAMLMNSIRYRSPAAPSADVLDTAANIITAIQSAIGGPIPPGLTWRHRVVMLTANAITYSATANTGVTVDAIAGNQAVVAASSFKDFLVTIVNGTPVRNVPCLTTNASAVLSGIAASDIANLSVGMIVTNAVVGQQGNTIIGINAAAGTVTMSGNSNATNASVPTNFVFSPVVKFTGITGIV
jgi:hypothetical protein